MTLSFKDCLNFCCKVEVENSKIDEDLIWLVTKTSLGVISHEIFILIKKVLYLSDFEISRVYLKVENSHHVFTHDSFQWRISQKRYKNFSSGITNLETCFNKNRFFSQLFNRRNTWLEEQNLEKFSGNSSFGHESKTLTAIFFIIKWPKS